MNYFKGFSTVEEIKTQYKKLAIKNHPDRGGDAEVMKQINNDYEAALKGCDGQTKQEDGKSYTYTYKADIEKEIIDLIYQLITIGNDSEIEIILIGRWVWILGDTKPVKDALKELGCRWHRERGCWFWRSASDRAYGKGGSLSNLAAKYGAMDCKEFSKESKKKAGRKFKATA